MEVDKELKDCFQLVMSKRQILNYHCFNNCVFQNFSSRLILVSMELTGHAQLDLCRGGAVILERGVAQVAALISGCHPRDVQGPVRQQGQPPARLETATADYFPSIFGPGGRPRRRNAGGGTRKSHDVAGRDRQCQVAGTFGQKCGCDGPTDGQSSNARRLFGAHLYHPEERSRVKTHLSSTNTRVEKTELRVPSWSSFQQVTSSSKGGETNGSGSHLSD